MKLTYNVEDRPGTKENLVFAFQQMIAIMAATLLVPLLITSFGLPADPAAALFGAGIGTLVYIFLTKRRSPVFLGSSFTFLPAYSLTIAHNYGYWGVIIGIVMAGLVYAVLALVIKGIGSGWVNRILPPVIIGPIVTLIGLSLSGTATSWMAGNGGDGYSLITILVGLITFIAIVLASIKGNKMVKLIPFIVGIGCGYIVALIFTLIGNAAGIESMMILDLSTLHMDSIVSLPKFTFMQAIKTNGQYAPIDSSAVASLALIFVPIAIVELSQHIGDHKNLGNIINRDLITDPGLDKTLLGDGIGSIVGGFFGGCANTTYGESIGCLAITGNASIYTIMTAGLGCMILSFFTPFVVLINSIPKCVMGGACVALYGFIAVSGLQMLKNVDLGDSKNLFVVSSILVVGIGGLTLNFGSNPVTGGALLTITALATALIVGILTNMIVKGSSTKEERMDNMASGHVEQMGSVPNQEIRD